MTIQEGHQGELFTRESLLGAIAEDQGADSARLVEETPPNGPMSQVPPNTQQQPAEQHLVQEQPSQQQSVEKPEPAQPQQAEQPFEEPITLGKPFEVRQETQNNYPQYDVDALIEEKLARRLNQKQEAAEEAGEEKPQNLTGNEVQRIIQETLAQRDREQAIEYEKRSLITNYENNLVDKLRNANVDIDNNKMLQDWITFKFQEGVGKVQQHLAQRGQYRQLTPNEYMEIANWHTEQVEKQLNMGRPKAQEQKGNISMMGSGQPSQGSTPQPNQQSSLEGKTVDQINKEAEEMAKKTGGKLRPSDAIKYARALMNAQNLNKMKF